MSTASVTAIITAVVITGSTTSMVPAVCCLVPSPVIGAVFGNMPYFVAFETASNGRSVQTAFSWSKTSPLAYGVNQDALLYLRVQRRLLLQPSRPALSGLQLACYSYIRQLARRPYWGQNHPSPSSDKTQFSGPCSRDAFSLSLMTRSQNYKNHRHHG